MGTAGNSVSPAVRVRLVVTGVVQGVGFRPFVYRLANAYGLAGHVANTGSGVRIEVEGPLERVQEFVAAVPRGAPPQGRIDRMEQTEQRETGQAGFVVCETDDHGLAAAGIPPDLATCPECVAELLAPENRRYRYPFITCTACGPRFSILDALPYDRHRTSMRRFPLCPDCGAEYASPHDRRFHAEPIACPACGPRLVLQTADGDCLAEGEEAIAGAVAEIAAGRIAALKGIGGYHLVADGTGDAAIASLRRRKRRPTKPFALMVADLDAARALCRLTRAEEDLLRSAPAPIVLAPRRGEAAVSELVAPGHCDLGLILPYAPVHHLLMQALGRPLAVTSANRSGEPILFDDRTALKGVYGMTDRILSHDRPIRRPIDDSVVRFVAGASQVLRLGRGLAPGSVAMPRSIRPGLPPVLALGGSLKAAPVLVRGHEAILGQHAGDLETVEAEAAFCRQLEDMQALHHCRADVLACDLHPDYATTHLAEMFGLPVVKVQHHAAHIASVMAEHDLAGPVLGFAWDGSGYGTDGTVWGGEALDVRDGTWRRAARLRPFPLPGGEQAVREPCRALYGLLHAAGRTDLLPAGLFAEGEAERLQKILSSDLSAPRTSSAGRLFDGLACLLGLGSVNRHEGEAAARLEACARSGDGEGAAWRYDFDTAQTGGSGLLELDWRPMLLAVARDVGRGEAAGRIAMAVHETLAAMIAAVARRCGATEVVLSGGCFQNRLLLERSMALLRGDGRNVFVNRRVPPGDGGLALGQALMACWVLEAES